jgi:hypothetical protein
LRTPNFLGLSFLAATDNSMLTLRLSNPTLRRLTVGIMQSHVCFNRARTHEELMARGGQYDSGLKTKRHVLTS